MALRIMHLCTYEEYVAKGGALSIVRDAFCNCHCHDNDGCSHSDAPAEALTSIKYEKYPGRVKVKLR